MATVVAVECRSTALFGQGAQPPFRSPSNLLAALARSPEGRPAFRFVSKRLRVEHAADPGFLVAAPRKWQGKSLSDVDTMTAGFHKRPFAEVVETPEDRGPRARLVI